MVYGFFVSFFFACGATAVTQEKALRPNLENAIKLFLAAKGMLSPLDVSTETSFLPEWRGKRFIPVRRKPVACILPDGCVTMPAKSAYLFNKFIPGNDNILGPVFTRPGHIYTHKEDESQTNEDFKMYLMSRPKYAVPEEVRKLLMPEGDGSWPGGVGGNRSAFYPKKPSAQKFWETDVEPIFARPNEDPK